MPSTIERAPSDEGGDDRRREVAAARLQQILDVPHPTLNIDEIEAYLAAHVEEPKKSEVVQNPEPPKESPPEVIGAKTLYSDTVPQVLGSRALQEMVEGSTRFRPAGVIGFALDRAKIRRMRYGGRNALRINGVVLPQ